MSRAATVAETAVTVGTNFNYIIENVDTWKIDSNIAYRIDIFVVKN